MTRPHSLRQRLLNVLIGAILVTALLQVLAVYLAAVQQADRLFDRHMQKLAAAVGSGLPQIDLEAPNAEFATNREDEDLFVQIWTLDGRPVFRRAAHAALRRPFVAGFSQAHATERTYRVFTLRTPTHIVQVAQDLDDRAATARGLALHAVAPILVLMLALMLAVWGLVGGSLAPVSRVRDHVAQRRADDLTPIPDTGLPDEILPLVREMNLLFERLQRAFEAQKNFVADAAHELRSPLAALKLQLQGLRQAPDEPARAVAMQRLGAGIERAAHLVDQLLVLARQEALAAAPHAAQPAELLQACILALSDTLPAAHERGVDLGVAQSQPCTVGGQAETLRLMVRNLLDNAVKYTPAGGTVDLSVRAVPGGAEIIVEDSGPGIPAAERERVMNRFYRIGTAGVEGNGLGLAIVQAIVRLHRAEIVLDDSPRLRGLRVTVRLTRGVAQSPLSLA